MTRAIDTLTDDEVAIYIETRRHKPRATTTRDIHSQRMAWAVEEIRAEERQSCAGICDKLAATWNSYTDIGTEFGRWYFAGKAVGGELCAAAIREEE